jgi:hypothetical protein
MQEFDEELLDIAPFCVMLPLYFFGIFWPTFIIPCTFSFMI